MTTIPQQELAPSASGRFRLRAWLRALEMTAKIDAAPDRMYFQR